MKSIAIKMDPSDIKVELNPQSIGDYKFLWYFKIPILPAFSVEYFSVHIGALSALNSSEDRIENDQIIFVSDSGEMEWDLASVVLNYHGIRDYSLLFPWVADSSLRERIGLFYEEADKNFDQGAWLSFALMCGAIFEGMLFEKLGHPSKTFDQMISTAYKSAQIINLNQKEIMHKVRRARNLVHANMFSKPYISRKDAMDIRATLNQLIKDFSK